MASLRRAKKEAKKRGEMFFNPKKQYTEKQKLQITAERNIKEVNDRLRELKKGGFYNSWASKKLFDRLDDYAQKDRMGKITKLRLKNNMNMTQLTAVNKATKNFLNSKTSSVKGIEKVRNKTKQKMYETFKAKREDVTKKDIDDYYEMLENDDFSYFEEKYSASEIWALFEESKEYEDTQARFLRRFNSLIDLNDEDIKAKAIRLYKKYM